MTPLRLQVSSQSPEVSHQSYRVALILDSHVRRLMGKKPALHTLESVRFSPGRVEAKVRSPQGHASEVVADLPEGLYEHVVELSKLPPETWPNSQEDDGA